MGAVVGSSRAIVLPNEIVGAGRRCANSARHSRTCRSYSSLRHIRGSSIAKMGYPMGLDSGTVAVLAEKPSVARDIARVVGAVNKGEGYLHGNGYVVTWALGHLVALAQPHEINAEWRSWRCDLLPMLPKQWPLVSYEKTRAQFEVVRKIMTSPRIAGLVCATDAGREGELIFRYIYEATQCQKPVSRLWISSLTADAIRKGFERLRPGNDYDSLAAAARGAAGLTGW